MTSLEEKRITWRLGRLKSSKVSKQYIREFEKTTQNMLKAHIITIATPLRNYERATTYIAQFNRQLFEVIYHS
jgi:hypothetical protein